MTSPASLPVLVYRGCLGKPDLGGKRSLFACARGSRHARRRLCAPLLLAGQRGGVGAGVGVAVGLKWELLEGEVGHAEQPFLPTRAGLPRRKRQHGTDDCFR